jgi:1,4-dihydroxy-2-naphthoate octaprenyltransferase
MHSSEQNIDFSNRTWRNIAKGLFMEIRIIPVFVWAFTAITTGTALAYVETGIFYSWRFVLAMLIACIVQGYPTHAANEIVDWLSGTDSNGFGGSKVIREGLLSVRDLKIIILGSMSVVVALAVLAIYVIDFRLLWFGVVGIAASLFYSLPPLTFAYRPFLGEWFGAFIGVFVAVTGGYYIQVLTLSFVAVLTGIAMGVADIAVMEMFHTIDYEADKSANPQKKTTIVLLGPERGQIYVIAYICAAAVLFWILALYHWQFAVWSVTAMACIYFYWNYDPRDPWSIIRNTKRVTYATIGAGVIFASFVYHWFVLLFIPVILGYIAHKKWGKLPKKKN